MDLSDSQRAMARWLGALGKGGVLRDGYDDAGDAVAAYVVGEAQLKELASWLASQPKDVAARERRAAIEVCIWMAHADRTIDPEETHLLREIIGQSLLDDDTQDALVDEAHAPPSLDGLEKRLTHPVLRELLLALSWELASIDGRVDKSELAFFTGLAKRLGVSEARAAEIQRALDEQL